ncbi:unnamed protein product [Albugo candida]|uniref:Uncharacterized protein n=1 Tax=Albugo candida TaxID=65357 RepID=A0A024FXT2_9STRA|nr:unnamed protein product [Albugo candida]|eukprot:CCI11459.1 unnamed protein product [Albugo candida]
MCTSCFSHFILVPSQLVTLRMQRVRQTATTNMVTPARNLTPSMMKSVGRVCGTSGCNRDVRVDTNTTACGSTNTSTNNDTNGASKHTTTRHGIDHSSHLDDKCNTNKFNWTNADRDPRFRDKCSTGYCNKTSISADACQPSDIGT